MKIIYRTSNDATEFDLDRYYKSLNKYGKVEKEAIKEALSSLTYDPMHYSVLVEIGVKLLPDEKSAKAYWEEHNDSGVGGFERLARITGYLVGSTDRWNDGKLAELHERVKHDIPTNKDGVYTQEEKTIREIEKVNRISDNQDEYHRGTCYDS